jgi:hypothetical protein
VKGNGNLLVGFDYTGLLGLKPVDWFEIKLGKKQFRLTPIDASDHEDRGKRSLQFQVTSLLNLRGRAPTVFNPQT